MTPNNGVIYSRQKFLFDSFDFNEGKVLEIGPLNEPLITKANTGGSCEIFYLDHLSTENLKIKYADTDSVSVDDIVPVDFVCPHGDIKGAVAGNTFDCVVASHVIEHAPNFLGFLKHIHDILRPGGTCILVVPDKRFTFDLNRPITTFGAVLENFLSEAKFPSIASVYDQSAMATKANGHNLWHGIVDANDSCLIASEQIAWEAAHQVHKNGFYFDVHVNIFTPESFFSILEKAISYEIVFFELSKFVDTKVGQIEFMLTLKKPENDVNELVKSKCLESMPRFEIENLLSPYMPQVKALSEALEASSKTLLEQQNQLGKLSVNLNLEREIKAQVEEQLRIAQRILDRKSVKFTLRVVNFLVNLSQKAKVKKSKSG